MAIFWSFFEVILLLKVNDVFVLVVFIKQKNSIFEVFFVFVFQVDQSFLGLIISVFKGF